MLEAFKLKNNSKIEDFLVINLNTNNDQEMIIWHPILDELVLKKGRIE